jgi:hypothetical protein
MSPASLIPDFGTLSHDDGSHHAWSPQGDDHDEPMQYGLTSPQTWPW